MSPKFKNSFLSLFALFLLAIGFQNMSWLEMNEIQSAKVGSPEAKYFPSHLNQTNDVENVGKQVLKHNISSLEEALKDKIEILTENRKFQFTSANGADNHLAAEYRGDYESEEGDKSSWAVGLTSAANYRVAYRGTVDLTCDMSAADQSYKVSVKRSISSTSDLRLVHDSKMRDSSLKMQISW